LRRVVRSKTSCRRVVVVKKHFGVAKIYRLCCKKAEPIDPTFRGRGFGNCLTMLRSIHIPLISLLIVNRQRLLQIVAEELGNGTIDGVILGNFSEIQK